MFLFLKTGVYYAVHTALELPILPHSMLKWLDLSLCHHTQLIPFYHPKIYIDPVLNG